MRKIITCLSCGMVREHKGRGVCQQCYTHHKHFKTLDQFARHRESIVAQDTDPVCVDCGQHWPVLTRGLCASCYRKHYQNKTLDQFAHGRRPKAVYVRQVRQCLSCGELRTIYGRGLCNTCYRVHQNEGTLDQFGRKARRQSGHYRTRLRALVCSVCSVCSEMKLSHSKGMCKRCYNRLQQRLYRAAKRIRRNVLEEGK